MTRRWYRFSLRTMLAVVTTLAVGLAWLGLKLQVSREREAVWDKTCGAAIPVFNENMNFWRRCAYKEFDALDTTHSRSLQFLGISPIGAILIMADQDDADKVGMSQQEFEGGFDIPRIRRSFPEAEIWRFDKIKLEAEGKARKAKELLDSPAIQADQP
jgi:hypothetical protein